MNKWKVGLVGTGYWSENHLNAWSRIPGVEISALCNRSPEKLLHKGKQFGVPEDQLFGSLEEMVERADIDIVDIVTGPETHLHMVSVAAKAGKQIMCQKPFAPSYGEAQAIVEQARVNGVRLMVTENWRWLQPYQSLKAALNEGILGQMHSARLRHKSFYTVRMSPESKLPQPFFRTMPHLLFYEMGPHWCDTWRFLFGTPDRLYADFTSISPYVIGDDTGAILLSHGDFHGLMDVSWATGEELAAAPRSEVRNDFIEQVAIDGENGTIRMDMDNRTKTTRMSFVDWQGKINVLVPPTSYDAVESHFRLQSHFIQCLHTGEPFQTSGVDNLTTMKMVFSAYESAEGHLPVKI